MQRIVLNPIPNQSLIIRLDDVLYTIEIKETQGVMSASITRAGVKLISGSRIVAGMPLLKYEYLENGNFILITNNEEIPYYTRFGIDQFLIFVSQSEIEAIRGTV